MAKILNIDTSSSICSVAVAIDGEIQMGLESYKKMDHSTSLAPFVKDCLDFLKKQGEKLDAVSVTLGPGSYTGLRIGLSMAKGLAFGLDIPLITLSSLKVMAVRAIFSDKDFQGDEKIVPMIDARRMEVFTGVYDSRLALSENEGPKILNEDTFRDLGNDRRVIFIGDGVSKFQPLYQHKNAVWIPEGMPHAKYMAMLSEICFRDKNFSDVAYTVPSYLKEYQTTIQKKLI